MDPTTKRRSIMAYIDGFNLYYGLLRDDPRLKWLDLNKLVKMLYPHYDIMGVKYFTACIPEEGPSKDRQAIYWNALEQRKVKIILGRLEERFKKCGAKQCTYSGFKQYGFPVEKRTDVNLAIHIITDARVMHPDAICIISGDTDLIPAMQMVAANYQCQRFAKIPCSNEKLRFRRVDEYELVRWDATRLVESVVLDSRFPDVITCDDDLKTEIKCPLTWEK